MSERGDPESLQGELDPGMVEAVDTYIEERREGLIGFVRDPGRDMPRGLIAGMGTLLVFAALILVFGPGGSGSSVIQDTGAPLTTAISAQNAYGSENLLFTFVNIVGLAGLIASFFSIIFAYSRQTFALSRAGYLPRWLSITGGRRTPILALIVPGVIGFILSLTGAGGLIEEAVPKNERKG